MGTPPQKNILRIDTGSETIGFENPRSDECQQSNHPCWEYGSYDNLTSSTAVYVSIGYQSSISNHATGVFVNDTIRFGGADVTDFMFGTWDEVPTISAIPAPDTGILGLGATCYTAACDSYPGFIQQVFERGVAGSRAYSVYLGPDEPGATGSLILNGIDTAKQAGPVHTLPMTDPASSLSNRSPNWANYTSFTFSNASGPFVVPADPHFNRGWLDTGNKYFGVDIDTFLYAADYYGFQFTSGESPDHFPVDCSFRHRNDASLTVTFAPGVEFEISMDRFVAQLEDGTCGTYLNPYGASFGVPFLRNLYVVFDMDRAEVQLSRAAYTHDSHIVPIR